MKKWLGFLVLLVSLVAQGGDAEGNGGHGVICYDNAHNIVSLELLDLYEARTFHKLKPDFEGVKSIEEGLELLFSRLIDKEPLRVEEFKKLYRDFLSNVTYLSGFELPLTEDLGPVLLPANCKIHQLAIQKGELHQIEHKYYVINKDYFDKMPIEQQAALIFHELVYRYKGRYTKDTRFIRRYVGAASDKTFIANMSDNQWAKYLSDVGFTYFTPYGCEAKSLTFHPNGAIMDADFVDLCHFEVGGRKFRTQYAEFSQNEILIGARLNGVELEFQIKGETIRVTRGVCFYEDGRLHGASQLLKNFENPVLHGYRLPLGNYYLELYPNGDFKAVTLRDDTNPNWAPVLMTRSGPRQFYRNARVHFDSEAYASEGPFGDWLRCQRLN